MEITRVRGIVGYRKLELRAESRAVRKQNPATRLDLSAIAKGYAVDRVALFLEAAGIGNYLVEIGGELRGSGVNDRDTAWRVAIEIPQLPGGVQAMVNLQDMSIATSGDYRNYITINGQKFSHTIDPRTGHPVKHQLASVSVLDTDTMTADALATALMVMGPEHGFSFARDNGLAVYMLVRDGGELTEKISTKFSQYLEIID